MPAEVKYKWIKYLLCLNEHGHSIGFQINVGEGEQWGGASDINDDGEEGQFIRFPLDQMFDRHWKHYFTSGCCRAP